MRKIVTLAVAALTMIGSVVSPASAAPFQGASSAVSQGAANASGVQDVNHRRGHYRGDRYYRGGRHYRGDRYYRGGRHYRSGRYYDRRHYRRDRNRAVAAGVAGLAAGAIIGGALSQNSAPGRSVAYCQQRYRSYDVRSGTYMGYDGVRRRCP
jgi:Ni/Co efflux regulator RcnB